jgi:hypothetical protein
MVCIALAARAPAWLRHGSSCCVLVLRSTCNVAALRRPSQRNGCVYLALERHLLPPSDAPPKGLQGHCGTVVASAAELNGYGSQVAGECVRLARRGIRHPAHGPGADGVLGSKPGCSGHLISRPHVLFASCGQRPLCKQTLPKEFVVPVQL